MTSPVPLQTLGATMEELMDELGPPRGYPQVATFMGNYPELAMVRRFRGLNARNLLYLQAELIQIEKKLLKCEKEDAKDKIDSRKKNYSMNFAWLLQHKDNNKQYDLILQMREKLKEYNDVLIQQTTLSKVSNPSEYDSKVIQHWFAREDLGNWPLEGDDASIWAHSSNPDDPKDGEGSEGVSQYIEDMIAISGASNDIDRTTNWLAQKFIPNYHAKIASRFRKNMHTYQEGPLYKFTAVVATTLSSLLPVVSIVVLYLVHSMPARLGIIAGFTAAFSFVLTAITSAKRVENFAATAAFAAVQVVFVGNNGNGTSTA